MATSQCLGAKNTCALSSDQICSFASFEFRRSADVVQLYWRPLLTVKKPIFVNKN